MHAVATICVGDFYTKLSKTSHPLIKEYADTIGADFVVHKTFGDHRIGAYEKFDLIHGLLENYDRVLFLDSDILVRYDSPDIFELVPKDKLGLFDEGQVYDRSEAWVHLFHALGFPLPPPAIPQYYNTGVIVASKCHRDLFIPAVSEVDCFSEQSFFNWRLWDRKTPVFSLPYRFNRIHAIGELTGEWWDDSYFAHFAGCFGKNNPSHDLNYNEFLNMARRFESYPAGLPEFKQNIRIDFEGALGDIVAGEPLVRFLVDEFYPKENVLIRTTQPDVFTHINAKVIGFNEDFDKTVPWYTITPLPKDVQNPIFHITHPLDFMSIKAFKGMLPRSRRAIKLQPASEIPWDVSRHVLIHAGKTWTSKAFPSAWWNSVIVSLLESGVPVALIGNYTVDLLRAEGVLDLRGHTDLKQLFRVIADAPLLISNDSSPVHIAGAFENPCIMIPTCKHPDFIWPQRKKSLNIAVGNLMKFDNRPNSIRRVDRVDRASEDDLLKILPDPQNVALLAVETWKKQCLNYGSVQRR